MVGISEPLRGQADNIVGDSALQATDNLIGLHRIREKGQMGTVLFEGGDGVDGNQGVLVQLFHFGPRHFAEFHGLSFSSERQVRRL